MHKPGLRHGFGRVDRPLLPVGLPLFDVEDRRSDQKGGQARRNQTQRRAEEFGEMVHVEVAFGIEGREGGCGEGGRWKMEDGGWRMEDAAAGGVCFYPPSS